MNRRESLHLESFDADGGAEEALPRQPVENQDDGFGERLRRMAKKYFQWLAITAGLFGSAVAEASEKEIPPTFSVTARKEAKSDWGEVRFARGLDSAASMGDRVGEATVSMVDISGGLRADIFQLRGPGGETQEVFETAGVLPSEAGKDLIRLELPQEVVLADAELLRAQQVVDGVRVDTAVAQALEAVGEGDGSEMPVVLRDLMRRIDETKVLPHVKVDFAKVAFLVGARVKL